MKLDSRLKSVADLVRKNKRVADIGTDHAYVPVYLVENNITDFVIASDVRKGPLQNAKRTVELNKLNDNIILRLSNGLKAFKDNEVEDIIVAGMGGLLIAQFIDDTKWLKSKDIHMILQPMTHVEELRKSLFDNGFIIDKEVISKDNNKLYITISAYYNGMKTEYNDFDLIVGNLLKNSDDLSKKYISHLYNKYNKKMVALKKAEKSIVNLEEIVRRLKKYES